MSKTRFCWTLPLLLVVTISPILGPAANEGGLIGPPEMLHIYSGG